MVTFTIIHVKTEHIYLQKPWLNSNLAYSNLVAAHLKGNEIMMYKSRGAQVLHYLVRLFVICVVFLFSCDADHDIELPTVELAIQKFYQEFQIKKGSYLIKQGEQIKLSYIGIAENEVKGAVDSVLFNFTGPLFLNYLVHSGALSDTTRLSNYFESRNGDGITINNLLESKNDQGSETIFPHERNKIIRSIIEKVSPNSFDSFVKDDLKIDKATTTTGHLLTNLEKVSQYFDSNNITKRLSKSSNIKDLYPTWYTKNTKSFYGWRIFKFQGNTILWNAFHLQKGNLLLMKDINRDLFLAVFYDDEMSCHDRLDDLMEFPIVLDVIDALYNVKYRGDLNLNSSASEFAKQLKRELRSPYNFILLRKIASYAKFLNRAGNAKKAEDLYEVYRNNCPSCIDIQYLDRPLLAGIRYASDNMSGFQSFRLEKTTSIKFFGVAQSKKITGYESQLYQFDNVELFIDLYNNKKDLLSITDHHYMFRFNYRSSVISGNTISNHGVKFAFNDLSDSTYALEIKIPWQNLDAYKARKNNKIGINILVGDSDEEENRRDRVLSLFINNIDLWNRPRSYGTMVLTQSLESSQQFQSVTTKIPIEVDGVHEKLWDNTHFTPIQRFASGNSSHSKDTAYVKTLWDENFVYFYFRIKDVIKNRPGIKTSDTYWIENADTGEVVWKFTGLVQPSFPTFFANGTFTLSKGKYLLKFETDDAHSFEGWYGTPPVLDMYGLLLFKSLGRQ